MPLPPIEHFIVLLLENRSFDHILGFSNLSGHDPSGKPTVIQGADPATQSCPEPASGKQFPVKMGADLSLKGVDADPGHEFSDTLTQLAWPATIYPDVTTKNYPPVTNKGFVASYKKKSPTTPERIMNCFEASQLPIINELAREFAVCDQWFSSIPGPTWPNRFFMMAATSGGLCDSPTTTDIIKATAFKGYSFQHGNIFDAMDKLNLAWCIFEGDKFPVSFALKGMNKNALKGRFIDFKNFGDTINKPGFNKKFIFIEPKYGDHEFDITGPGDFSGGNSMHPLGDVQAGETLIKNVYETLRASVIWQKSALLIVFDEHGGFYDHVPPPSTIPPGDDHRNAVKNHTLFGFDQLGVRVPAIVVSPLIKKGTIDHTVYDHSSALATIERLFGIPNLTERDRRAADLLHLFSSETARTDTPEILGVSHSALGFTGKTVKPAAIPPQEPESAASLRAKLSLLDSPEPAKSDKLELAPAPVVPPASLPQVGFSYIALMRALSTKKNAGEATAWKQEFQRIKTQRDAARFMTRSKLKVYHGVYVPRPA